MELPRAVSIASEPTGESLSYGNQERTDGGIHDESFSFSQNLGRQRQKIHDPARDLSIQVLEKFSLVTKFARETTSQLFGENQSNGFGAIDRKCYSHFPPDIPPDIPPNVSKDSEKIPDESPVPSDPLEVTPFFPVEFYVC